MSLNGQFYHPDHAGEGFYLTEQNGRLIGAFFTFDGGGAATWYVFDCNRTGDTYSGQVSQVEGGTMGSPTNKDTAYQIEVGSIIFVEDDEWSFEATISGITFGYTLTKLFPTDGEPEPEPEPEPDVSIEHKFGNEWLPLDVPVTGTIQGISTSQITNKKLVRAYRITADQPLSLTTSTFNFDPAFDLNPSIEVNGNIVRIFLGPSIANFPGLTKHAGFKVIDANLGLLIEVNAQVAGA